MCLFTCRVSHYQVPSLHCRSSVCTTCPSDYVWFMSPLLPAVNPPGEPFNSAHIMQTPRAAPRPPHQSACLSCGPFEHQPARIVRSNTVFLCFLYILPVNPSIVSFSLTLTFEQCHFASCKHQKLSEDVCAFHSDSPVHFHTAIDFPRHPVAHSRLSDGLHSLFHPSHPCPSSSSPPTSSLHSHFPSSLKNDSCRDACLINASYRLRNCGETRGSFQNMADGNGDLKKFRTISLSSFTVSLTALGLSCGVSTCCHRLKYTINSFMCRNRPECAMFHL